MVFNFKNKNFIIIFLLILVVGSCVCYNIMRNNVEGFTTKSRFKKYFTFIRSKEISGNDFDYYKLNDSNYDFSINGMNFNLNTNRQIINFSNNNYFNDNPDTSYNFYTRITSDQIELAQLLNGTINLVELSNNNVPDISNTVNFMFTHKKDDLSYNIYNLSGERLNITLNITLHITLLF